MRTGKWPCSMLYAGTRVQRGKREIAYKWQRAAQSNEAPYGDYFVLIFSLITYTHGIVILSPVCHVCVGCAVVFRLHFLQLSI